MDQEKNEEKGEREEERRRKEEEERNKLAHMMIIQAYVHIIRIILNFFQATQRFKKSHHPENVQFFARHPKKCTIP